jgi:hypothetical protein
LRRTKFFISTEAVMYKAQLAIVELREKAFVARDRAQRAQRLATRTKGNAREALRRAAAEYETKAAMLESQAGEAAIGDAAKFAPR